MMQAQGGNSSHMGGVRNAPLHLPCCLLSMEQMCWWAAPRELVMAQCSGRRNIRALFLGVGQKPH